MSSRHSPCPRSVSSRSCTGNGEVKSWEWQGELGAGIIPISCLRLRAPGTVCTQWGESAYFSLLRLQKRDQGISREVCRWIPGWAANVGGWLRGGNTARLPKPCSLTATRRRSEISQALSILQNLHLIKKTSDKKPEHLVKSSFSGRGSSVPGPGMLRRERGRIGLPLHLSCVLHQAAVPGPTPHLHVFNCGCGQTRC